MKHLSLVAMVSPFVFLVCSLSAGEDWPQFRHDVGRTAATSESLPESLHPLWIRELPPPRPAFPGEIRLRYDATYEPVIAGNRLFVPSMVTDCLTALDLDTGAVQWEFFAESPIRFAPAVSDHRVYFVSDDGYLYCVDAANGKLLWKFRGASEGKSLRKVLCNGRLVSLVPARGGPLVAEGVVYFAAGIWSGEGVFVHALDAKTGQPVWSNTDSDQIERANMDHGISYVAGIAPQGYLTIIGNRLVVPCGAQLPAVFDLKTGELGTYTIGWGGRIGLAKGCWFTAGVKNFLFHGGDLYDILRANNEKFRSSRGSNDFKKMLYLGGLTRLQIDRTNQKALGMFRRPVLTPDTMFYHDGQLVASDLTQGTVVERATSEVPNFRRQDQYPDKLRGLFPERWRMPSKSRVHIKSGNRLFCGGLNLVEAVDIPEKEEPPKIGWNAPVQGTPHAMLAANGKLVVVTRQGRLYAFGAEERAEPIVHALPTDPAPKPDTWTALAGDLVKRSDTNVGYVLALGIGSGRLVEELALQSQRDVIVIEADAEKVDTFRRTFHQAGLYGTRISVLLGDPATYPLPPYFASLIVSEAPTCLGDTLGSVCADTLIHCLRPYGGIAHLTLSESDRNEFAKAIADDESSGITVLPPGNLVFAMRGGALPDSADWTHRGANAANTGASLDRFLKPPLARLWFDGSFRWNRTPGSSIVRIASGRIFVYSGSLYAIDVYTGRRLWQSEGFGTRPTDDTMAAVDDAIYLASGRVCVVLDPTCGEKIHQFDLPNEVDAPWSIVRVSGDWLLGACGKWMVCFDRHSGDMVWKHPLSTKIASLAVGGGMIFASDFVYRRRGEKPKDVPLHALDIRTGTIRWQSTGGEKIRYYQPDHLLCTSGGIVQASDGAHIGNASVLLVSGNRLVVGDDQQVTLHDPKTGVKMGQSLQWVRRGCTRLRASEHILTTRFMGNAAFLDLSTGKITSLWNVRAACSNNLFVANGVLNIPNLSGGCTCNYLPISQAFVPASVIERKRKR